MGNIFTFVNPSFFYTPCIYIHFISTIHQQFHPMASITMSVVFLGAKKKYGHVCVTMPTTRIFLNWLNCIIVNVMFCLYVEFYLVKMHFFFVSIVFDFLYKNNNHRNLNKTTKIVILFNLDDLYSSCLANSLLEIRVLDIKITTIFMHKWKCLKEQK